MIPSDGQVGTLGWILNHESDKPPLGMGGSPCEEGPMSDSPFGGYVDVRSSEAAEDLTNAAEIPAAEKVQVIEQVIEIV